MEYVSNSNPKVSVIVPCYNQEKYIAECLDSILAQTFNDYEIIVVDDGSTDNSVSIIEEYIEKYKKIHLISQENQGVIAARNNAIKQAKGMYIYPLDGDDIVAETLLEKLCKAMEEGRDCPYSERERYSAWDRTEQEREKIAEELRKTFPQYEIAVGGSISMDITPQGFGKGQIAKHLRETYPNDKIVFFGDKTFVGGNDYELASTLQGIDNTQVVQVNDPEEVLMFLNNNL